MASGDELVPFTTGEVQRASADAPAANIAVVLIQLERGDVPPIENPQDIIVGVAQQPGADARSEVGVGESDAPLPLHDVAGNRVRYWYFCMLTHQSSLELGAVDACGQSSVIDAGASRKERGMPDASAILLASINRGQT